MRLTHCHVLCSMPSALHYHTCDHMKRLTGEQSWLRGWSYDIVASRIWVYLCKLTAATRGSFKLSIQKLYLLNIIQTEPIHVLMLYSGKSCAPKWGCGCCCCCINIRASLAFSFHCFHWMKIKMGCEQVCGQLFYSLVFGVMAIAILLFEARRDHIQTRGWSWRTSWLDLKKKPIKYITA